MLDAIAYSCLQSTSCLVQCAPFVPFLQHPNGSDSFVSSSNLRHNLFYLEGKILRQPVRVCNFAILDFLKPSPTFCLLTGFGQVEHCEASRYHQSEWTSKISTTAGMWNVKSARAQSVLQCSTALFWSSSKGHDPIANMSDYQVFINRKPGLRLESVRRKEDN